MSARSRAAQSATRLRGATLSKPRTRKLSSKKSCLVFVAPRMTVPCTLLRFKPKEEAFACGNARNVARRERMRGPRTSWGKRWERDLLVVSLRWQIGESRSLFRLVRPCPRLHPCASTICAVRDVLVSLTGAKTVPIVACGSRRVMTTLILWFAHGLLVLCFIRMLFTYAAGWGLRSARLLSPGLGRSRGA
jgi:hypothetical protein